jgi:hypothetical protein
MVANNQISKKINEERCLKTVHVVSIRLLFMFSKFSFQMNIIIIYNRLQWKNICFYFTLKRVIRENNEQKIKKLLPYDAIV